MTYFITNLFLYQEHVCDDITIKVHKTTKVHLLVVNNLILSFLARSGKKRCNI